jgi:hypothetical protein
MGLGRFFPREWAIVAVPPRWWSHYCPLAVGTWQGRGSLDPGDAWARVALIPSIPPLARQTDLGTTTTRTPP